MPKWTDNLLRRISCRVFMPSAQDFLCQKTYSVGKCDVFCTRRGPSQVTQRSTKISGFFKKQQKSKILLKIPPSKMLSHLIKTLASSQRTCEEMLKNSDQLHSCESRYFPQKMANERKMGKSKNANSPKSGKRGQKQKN